MSKLVTLDFTMQENGYHASQPVQIGGNFALHLTFSEDNKVRNSIAVYRSATGQDFVRCYRTDWSAPRYDRTFGDAVSGMYVQIVTLVEPTGGSMLCEGLE